MKLQIAKELELPLEVATQKNGFLGTTGSGKSYAAMKLAEQLWHAKAQFVTLDPVGVWWGLRLAADGKKEGIPITIFGGLKGDVPIRPQDGKLIADVVCDYGISAIIDVSQFEDDADKAKFVNAWSERFWFRKKQSPSAIHLFMEECQEFINQDPPKGETLMQNRLVRICKIGRNYGIGVSMISQRPQEVSKKALNLCELVFAFQMNGPHERAAVAGWLKEKGIATTLADDLPTLEVGCPHVWSPRWLKISKVVSIGKRETFDASATPKVGETPVATRSLGAIDLEKVKSALVAIIAETDANDPAKLKARIRQLESEKAKAEKAPAPPDQSVIDAAVQSATGPLIRRIDGLETIIGEAAEISSRLGKVLTNTAETGGLISAIAKMPTPRQERPLPVARAPRPNPVPSSDVKAVEGITQPQQKFLNAIAWFESMGISQPTRMQVAFKAGYRPNSGNTNNIYGQLNTAGRISYPSPGFISLTDEGRTTAAFPDVAPDMESFHAGILGILSGSQQKLLNVLLGSYPDRITREQLGEATGYAHNSGNFNNLCGQLKTLGLIEYPFKGQVRASDLLFPEGL